MTRINVGYPVKQLNTKMLLAEHREIKRIPNMVKSGKAKLINIPDKFTLGTGHVKFFYNKLGYLWGRYLEIRSECLERGFKITNYAESWYDTEPSLWGYYKPTKADKQLIVDRINSKLNK